MTTSNLPAHVNVELGQASYPIYIGQHLLSDAAQLWKRHIVGQQVLIVSSSVIAAHYLSELEASLADYQIATFFLQEGEAYKTLTSFSQILDRLTQLKFNRQSTLLALGGGVIGDVTGFAASCYLRGVNFIQIPTSLLAQVDASVGGKTGVNHALGKNLIGTFHQPRCVVIDTHTLQTLPERELRAGLAEVVKHALIADAAYLDDIEQHHDLLLARDSSTLVRIIQRSCEIKAAIVGADEREVSGQRALLNFGHTFAHALETVTEYQSLLHGEAVAIGMICALRLSQQLGYINAAAVERITQLLTKFDLPVRLPQDIVQAQLLELMQHDKKARDQGLQFVVLEQIGHAVLRADITPQQVAQTFS